MEFHIQKFGPTNPWPNGGWSLYRITGEDIASRTVWERRDGKLEITERWPWPGFIGCFATLEQVVEAIAKER
jgi:hypothetical protein